MPTVLKVTGRNARFQQWQALLTNRTKRNHAREFIVQGVRPLTLAVEHGWPIRMLLCPSGQRLSDWAREVLDKVEAKVVQVDPDLLRELGEKDERPDLLAVVGIPDDDLDRIPVDQNGPIIVFDRPSNPGNIGTVIRSADAFGAAGVIVTAHAADVYDPKTVRASTGSLFAVPVVRQASHKEVLAWAREHELPVVGTDETGSLDIDSYDLTGPRLLVVGNEARGMTVAWREACDVIVRIPIGGSASSLNAAAAASILLYECALQRRARAADNAS